MSCSAPFTDNTHTLQISMAWLRHLRTRQYTISTTNTRTLKTRTLLNFEQNKSKFQTWTQTLQEGIMYHRYVYQTKYSSINSLDDTSIFTKTSEENAFLVNKLRKLFHTLSMQTSTILEVN